MKQANLTEREMLKTFNCGYGMVLIIDNDDLQEVSKTLNKLNQKFKIIGKVKSTSGDPEVQVV